MKGSSRQRARRTWIDLSVAGVGGLLAATAFPPIDFGPMMIVGLAPLLWTWRRATPAHAALLGFVWGLAFFGAVVYWIVYFGAIAIVAFVSALAAFTAAVGAAVGWFRRYGIRSAWVTAALWTIVEVIRGRFPLGGFPWADAGVGMADLTPALALARWGGATLVSFLVVLVTGLAVAAIDAAVHHSASRAEPRWRLRMLGTFGGIGAVVLLTGVALVTASVGPATTEMRFALVQGNDLNRELTADEREQRYLPRRHFELADTLTGDYDLVVFPESSMDRDPRRDEHLSREIRRVAVEHDSFVLSNAGVVEPDGTSFNMNLLHAPDGKLAGTYAKQRLVPFGEYVPFEWLVGWIPPVSQVPSDYTPGEEGVIFDLDGTRVATIICFENAFADITRDAVRDGAEVLVVSTNNRSYRRSSNPAQHVNLSRMRAAETGRPVLHASISGLTAVVDADGTVLEESELFVNSVTQGVITARAGQTPYVRYGNWTGASSLLIVAAAGIVAYARRRAVTSGDPPVESATA